MPHNNAWRRENHNFLYKPQDFTHSCFPACLQMALVNFNIIGIRVGRPGRPIEDAFNLFCLQAYDVNIDEAAPNPNMVERFMIRTFFQGRDRIEVQIISPMTAMDQAFINNRIQDNQNIAIIGAVQGGGGHATMIIKKEGNLYAVNPGPMLNGYYFPGIYPNFLHLAFFEHPDGIGMQCDQIQQCIMTYCYIIIPH